MKKNIMLFIIFLYIWFLGYKYQINFFLYPKEKTMFELLKLFIYPSLILMIIDIIIIKEFKIVFTSYILSITLGLFTFILLYYLYIGFMGREYIFVNNLLVLSTYIIIVLSKTTNLNQESSYYFSSALFLVCFISVMYIYLPKSLYEIDFFKEVINL